jgi:hypothetical protein
VVKTIYVDINEINAYIDRTTAELSVFIFGKVLDAFKEVDSYRYSTSEVILKGRYTDFLLEVKNEFILLKEKLDDHNYLVTPFRAASTISWDIVDEIYQLIETRKSFLKSKESCEKAS